MMIISVGMIFAISSRNIDLALASLIALSGMTFVTAGSIILAIIAGFITAVVAELFNGLLIARLGINPLIVTLACWIWARELYSV